MFALQLWRAGLGAAAPLDDEAATCPNASVRQQAAVFLASAGGAHSLNLLWVLSFDVEPDVRQAALDAIIERCVRERKEVCAAFLGFFAADSLAQIAWQARDHMLAYDVLAAVRDADRAYKLDLLSRLMQIPQLAPATTGRVLRLLQDDADEVVQQNAAWLLGQAP